ncbi:MAG: M15 family metallopeptidase [Melioribacteraceae bacterium]|nr:M15 family metallopeptidase [Melioribacteraceae bacterium]
MFLAIKIFLTIYFFIQLNEEATMQEFSNSIVVDSELSFEDAVDGLDIPLEIKKNLTLITVLYNGYDNKIHKGQLLLHRNISAEVKEIFDVILSKRFPIEKVIPIVHYGWDDNRSMNDNNTSAFNYRKIDGSDKLSNHSYGVAIDINPLQNPFVKGKKVLPKGAKYDKNEIGTIDSNSIVVKVFKRKGLAVGRRLEVKKRLSAF